MTKVSVIGGGSWGTALARELANNGHDTILYIRNKEDLKYIEEFRENKKYLPGANLPNNLKYSGDLKESVKDREYILLSVTTASTREILNKLKGIITEDVILINASKGIEENTLMRISEIAAEILPDNKFVSLSGPTHAEEVALDYPSTIVAASYDLDAAQKVQNLFMSDTLRVYTNDDLIGVELSGALKNIIALGAGMLDGMGYGDNSKAALITRGLAEITKLGIKMGALPSTFYGLTGVGDLIVTCTSKHSRNRKCGELIGKGYSAKEAVENVGMVVEGIKTTNAAYLLAKKYGVEMPITNILYDVIHNEKDVKIAVQELMQREKKHEMQGLRG